MSYHSASSDSSSVIKLVIELTTGIRNYYNSILTSVTIFCFMNFFMEITVPGLVQVTRRAGLDLLQCCSSSQELWARMTLWEFRMLATGKLFRCIVNRLSEVD